MAKLRPLVIGTAPPEPLGPEALAHRCAVLERILVAVLLAGFAAHLWLMSSPLAADANSELLRPWNGSWLEAVAYGLALGYDVPTLRGVEVKPFILRLTAVAALFLASLRYGLDPTRGAPRLRWRQWRDDPASTVGLLLILGWAWSALAGRWALRPDLAWATAEAALFPLALALAVGIGLGRRSVRSLLAGATVILALTALLGLWYATVRSPEQRLSYPVGNPLFLAATLVAGLLLAAGLALTWQQEQRTQPGAARRLAGRLIALYAGVLALCVGLFLTDSRTGGVALAVGAAACAWCAVGWRARLAGLALALAGTLLAFWFYLPRALDAGGSRAETLVTRLYFAQYAADLWRSHPLGGGGPGSYLLQFARRSAGDRLEQPMAFAGDYEWHCHSEPLQRLAEQGPVGLLLYVLPLAAVLLAVRPPGGAGVDWLLAGATGAVVALWVDSALSPGLSGPGVSFAWALAWGVWLAAARGEPEALAVPLPADAPPQARLPKLGLFVAAFGFMGWGTWVAAADWAAARADWKAHQALAGGRLDDAVVLFDQAASDGLESAQKLRAEVDVLAAGVAQLNRGRTQLTDLAIRQSATQPTVVMLGLMRQYVDLLEALVQHADRLQHIAAGTLRLPVLRSALAEHLVWQATFANSPEERAQAVRMWHASLADQAAYEPASVGLAAARVLSADSPLTSTVQKTEALAQPLLAGLPDLEAYARLLDRARSAGVLGAGLEPQFAVAPATATASAPTPQDQPEWLRLTGYLLAQQDQFELAAAAAAHAAELYAAKGRTRLAPQYGAARAEQALWLALAGDRVASAAALADARTAMPGLGLPEQRRRRLTIETLITWVLDGSEAAWATAPAWQKSAGREAWQRRTTRLLGLLAPSLDPRASRATQPAS